MKEIHEYRSVELISFLTLCSTVIFIFAAVLFKNSEDPNLKKALRAAESLSGQLAQAGLRSREIAAQLKSRTPASAVKLNNPVVSSAMGKRDGLFGSFGSISRDPWGNAFQYRFVQHQSGDFYLFVWSLGPNGKKESTGKYVASIVKSENENMTFLGDDIGVHRVLK